MSSMYVQALHTSFALVPQSLYRAKKSSGREGATRVRSPRVLKKEMVLGVTLGLPPPLWTYFPGKTV